MAVTASQLAALPPAYVGAATWAHCRCHQRLLLGKNSYSNVQTHAYVQCKAATGRGRVNQWFQRETVVQQLCCGLRFLRVAKVANEAPSALHGHTIVFGLVKASQHIQLPLSCYAWATSSMSLIRAFCKQCYGCHTGAPSATVACVSAHGCCLCCRLLLGCKLSFPCKQCCSASWCFPFGACPAHAAVSLLSCLGHQ
jgi:hypothetical protein